MSTRDPETVQRLYDFEDLDFGLRPGSAAIDRGMVIPNVNDGFSGSAPDLGALEATLFGALQHTGDLLHGWMPYMGDSYPPEWVATLDAVGAAPDGVTSDGPSPLPTRADSPDSRRTR